jgi:hypothetical protein
MTLQHTRNDLLSDAGAYANQHARHARSGKKADGGDGERCCAGRASNRRRLQMTSRISS